MNTYTVTVGRDIGDSPMPSEKWDTLILTIVKELTHVTYGAWVEVHTGTGQYDGTTEESAMVTLLTEEYLSAGALTYIREFLKNLAGEYGQECIALTVGSSELIYA